jgi:hypothetical protein
MCFNEFKRKIDRLALGTILTEERQYSEYI